MRSYAIVVFVVLLGTASARAAIWLEVTPAGEAANGLESVVDTGDVTNFHVWISADSVDSQLFNIQFDLGSEVPGDWNVLSLGTIDPDGIGTANPTSNSSGSLSDGMIHNALFIEHPFASLSATPWRLYADFTAVGVQPGSRLTAQVDSFFSSSLGTQPVHLIGVTAVPEPSVAWWALMIAAAAVRRSTA